MQTFTLPLQFRDFQGLFPTLIVEPLGNKRYFAFGASADVPQPANASAVLTLKDGVLTSVQKGGKATPIAAFNNTKIVKGTSFKSVGFYSKDGPGASKKYVLLLPPFDLRTKLIIYVR